MLVLLLWCEFRGFEVEGSWMESDLEHGSLRVRYDGWERVGGE